jgi:hypothetical protein
MTMSRSRSAMRYATLMGALALGAFPTRAHADAVPPTPTDCAVGAQGGSCHGGAYCTPPSSCTTNADCTAGETCQPTALCIAPVLCYSSVVGPDGGSSTTTEQSVEGLCSGGTCSPDGGATCTTLSICVAPSSTVAQGGCSCGAVGGSSGSMAVAMLALGAAAAALASHRRARPEAQRAARQRRA